MRKLVSLLLCISLVTPAHAGLFETDRALVEKYREILDNPGFESGKARWTASGGTFTVDATSKGTGAAGAYWDSNGNGQTITSTAVAIPAGYYGRNGLVSCNIKNIDGTTVSAHTLTVDDGTNDIVSSQTINNSFTNFVPTQINFVFPSSGNIRLKLKSNTNNEPEIRFDDCSIRLADNIGNVSQAVMLGSIKYTAGSGLAWTQGTNSYTNYSANASLNTPTTTPGTCTATGTKLPAIQCSAVTSGDYLLIARGRFGNSSGNGLYRFTDGTNTTSEMLCSGGGCTEISGRLRYTTPQGTLTFQIQGKNGGAGSADIILNTDVSFEMDVYYYPTLSQQAVSSANADYGKTSYTPTFTGFGTPTGVECFHSRTNEFLDLDCKYTSGTTTATEARVSFPSGLTSADTTRIPSIRSCGTHIDSHTAFDIIGGPLCEPSVTYFTIGRNAAGESAFTKLNGNSFSTSGRTHHFIVRVPIQGWSTNQRAPTLVGSVTSNSSGALRFEAAKIGSTSTTACTSSPCGSVNQLGSNWISTVTRNSTGNYTINIPSGTFSAAPICTFAPGASGGAPDFCQLNDRETATSVPFICQNDAGTATDAEVSVHCMGPR